MLDGPGELQVSPGLALDDTAEDTNQCNTTTESVISWFDMCKCKSHRRLDTGKEMLLCWSQTITRSWYEPMELNVCVCV